MAYILDSRFVYAQLNGKDVWHSRVSEAMLEAKCESVVLPVPAITEVAYLLARRIGVHAAAEFADSLAETDLIIEAPTSADHSRSAEILRRFDDVNIDFVDALRRRVHRRDGGAPARDEDTHGRSPPFQPLPSGPLRGFRAVPRSSMRYADHRPML